MRVHTGTGPLTKERHKLRAHTRQPFMSEKKRPVSYPSRPDRDPSAEGRDPQGREPRDPSSQRAKRRGTRHEGHWRALATCKLDASPRGGSVHPLILDAPGRAKEPYRRNHSGAMQATKRSNSAAEACSRSSTVRSSRTSTPETVYILEEINNESPEVECSAATQKAIGIILIT